MKSHLRGWVVLGASLALAVGLLPGTETSAAQDKGLVDTIQKIAAAFEKGDKAGAAKLAAAAAKDVEMEDLMHLYVLRTKKGLGVGDKPGAISPDGLEKKLMKLAENAPGDKELGEEGEALTKMGYTMAALAALTHAKPPEKDDGKKKKKDWLVWAEEQQNASLEFAVAAKAKKGADLMKAAAKADKACGKCHDVFRFD